MTPQEFLEFEKSASVTEFTLAAANHAPEFARRLVKVEELMKDAARIEELAVRLVAPGGKAEHVSCSETHEIAEWILEVVEALKGEEP